MNTRSLLRTALVLAGIAGGAVTVTVMAATTTADQARMEACFRAHGQLMSKPALTNIRDCWRAHGYLMER